MNDSKDFVQQYLDALGRPDIDAALAFYADDAEVVRYEGVAQGRDAIRGFLPAS